MRCLLHSPPMVEFKRGQVRAFFFGWCRRALSFRDKNSDQSPTCHQVAIICTICWYAMKILALETSTEHCSLALWLDGEILVRAVPAQERHSQVILPLLQALLADAQVRLTQLNGIAFGAGPGSFTGLRIACGIAQGLAFGANLPVVGISDLMALAEASNCPKVIAILDARMGEIYHAVYERRADQWQELSAPGLYLPQHAPAVSAGGWVGVGSGFNAHKEVLLLRYAEQFSEINADLVPHAKEIAILGAQALLNGRGLAPDDARPIYIRDKVAQTIAERRTKN